MISAIVHAVTDTHLIGEIFAGFRVDVAGKLMRFSTRGTGVTAVFTAVFFEMVAEGGHYLVNGDL